MRQIWISVAIDKNNNIIDNAQCPHAWTLIKITKYGLVWTLIKITKLPIMPNVHARGHERKRKIYNIYNKCMPIKIILKRS